MQRKRWVYVLIVSIVILIGLGSRILKNRIPEVIELYIGDIAWATMIYLWVCVLVSKIRFVHCFWISFLICYAVEFSQLYHASWIDGIRSTRIGALVLGNSFVVSDLVCYLIGVSGGLVIDLLIHKYCWTNRLGISKC
jgi:hypothetical protein